MQIWHTGLVMDARRTYMGSKNKAEKARGWGGEQNAGNEEQGCKIIRNKIGSKSKIGSKIGVPHEVKEQI